MRKVEIQGEVAIVHLSKGYKAIIDSADANIASQYSWRADIGRRKDGSIRTVYARSERRNSDGSRDVILLHRLLLSPEERMHVDHIDGDGLNNRRCNIRIASPSQNQWNKRTPESSVTGMKGVSFKKNRGKFQATIRVLGKTRHLGLFSDVSEARKAYCDANRKMHPEFGRAD